MSGAIIIKHTMSGLFGHAFLQQRMPIRAIQSWAADGHITGIAVHLTLFCAVEPCIGAANNTARCIYKFLR